MKKLKEIYFLFISIFLYVTIFSFFSIMRHLSSKLGDPDLSIFGQGFYTALKFGMPFFNTFEGGSHFAYHNSPIFYLLLPFYAIYPSIITLNILQSLALGLGAVPLFLIARDKLGEKNALFFSILYLLYHPLHGINYDQFNELSFAVTPLFFALYFFLKRRFLPFWVCIILTLMCKEDAAFVVIFWGIYGIVLGFLEKKNFSLLATNSIIMIAIGTGYLYLSLYIIIPHFSHVHNYGYFSERYGYLGSNLPSIMANIILQPITIIKVLLQKERLLYFLEMFLPLAFIPFFSPGLLFMTIPVFLINLLSQVAFMYNTGSRYNAYLIPFIFGATVLALEKILSCAKYDDREKVRKKIFSIMFILTILCSLLINNTPLRIGFKVPMITEHQKKILFLTKTIPRDASVSTQVDILQHLCHRIHAYASYYPGSDYIFVDETSKWHREYSHWEEKLQNILNENNYEKIYDEDGIKIYRLAEGKKTL